MHGLDLKSWNFIKINYICGATATKNIIQNIWHMTKNGVLDGIIMFPKRWDSVIKKQGDYIEGFRTDDLKV